MDSPHPTPSSSELPDRSSAIKAFGIVQIVLGALAMLPWICLIWAVGLAVYQLRVLRHFRRANSEGAA